MFQTQFRLTSRGKFVSAGEREPFLLTIRLNTLTYIPMFCTFRALPGILIVEKTNKRNESETLVLSTVRQTINFTAAFPMWH